MAPTGPLENKLANGGPGQKSRCRREKRDPSWHGTWEWSTYLFETFTWGCSPLLLKRAAAYYSCSGLFCLVWACMHRFVWRGESPRVRLNGQTGKGKGKGKLHDRPPWGGVWETGTCQVRDTRAPATCSSRAGKVLQGKLAAQGGRPVLARLVLRLSTSSA